jgi:hypothetical protein
MAIAIFFQPEGRLKSERLRKIFFIDDHAASFFSRGTTADDDRAQA